MNKKLLFWEISGVFISFILMTILHFLYELIPNNLTSLISAVNVSVWEHLKIAFYSIFIFGIIQYAFISKKVQNFWYAKFLSLIMIISFITITYYSYTMILGRNYLVIDIFIAFLGIVISYYISYKINISIKAYENERVSVLAIIVMVSIFFIFTISPPKLPIFLDKTTNTYGIK